MPAAFLLLALSALRLAGADLATGRLLVASRQVSDPRFTESVVLLIHHDQTSAMGLILNRRSNATLSSLFPSMGRTTNKSDPVYIGGPVGVNRVLALARSRAAPAGTSQVLAGVHLVAERPNLERILAAGARSDMFRVYLGYAGWTTGRLEREVAAGLWYVLPGDASLAFDPQPESLWKRLMRKFEGQLAEVRYTASIVEGGLEVML